MKTNHFNWSNLFKEKNPGEFLAGDGTLWGEGQGPDNPGRIEWLKIGNQIRNTTTNSKKIKIGELGFGAAIDFQMWKNNGLLKSTPNSTIEYYGLDVTPEFCALAASNHPEMKVTLINGYDIPYHTHFFDCFYMRHVLEHQENYRWQLREVFRVTKENIIINFFIPLSDLDFDEIKYDDIFYHNKLSKKLFYKFCNKYGWEEERTVTHITENSTDQVLILRRIRKPPTCFITT